MGHRSDDRFLVLHGLRLKGFAEADAVAAAVGVPERTVEEHLATLAAEELAVRREGRLTGWSLTPAGRVEQQRLAGEELVATGTGDAVEAGYQRFLALNGEMLATCTAWQVRDDGPNEHDDAAYDAAVVARLHQLHRSVLPVLDDLTGTLERYGGYRLRFDRAISRLLAGEQDWFTKPIMDSYHTIWFELHEDLLTTLGRERSQETT
jgi:hypothetical protein